MSGEKQEGSEISYSDYQEAKHKCEVEMGKALEAFLQKHDVGVHKLVPYYAATFGDEVIVDEVHIIVT